MDTDFSRRKFLTTTSLASAAAFLAAESQAAVVNNGTRLLNGLSNESLPWQDKTMRWVQIVFTEGDAGRYDPQWWLDLFKRSHVQGVCLVAGGMTSFYPTKIPYHPKASSVKDGNDMFGDLAFGAKKLGITVVARTDAQACTNEAAQAHPEWLNIDENGIARKHKSLPERFTGTCAYGDYNFKHMTAIHREIVELYQVEGLFCNRWQGWARGMCYCKTCQDLFKDFCGRELPRKHADRQGLQSYYEWETVRLTELWSLWQNQIQAINPDARYFSNIGIDIDKAAELSPTYMSETQQRGHNFPWHVGEQGKRTQAIFGPKKRIIALNGMTLQKRHSVAPEAEVRMWLLNAVTNGLSPWLIKSSASNWDKRWIPALEKVYGWHHANESYLRNEVNLANVGLFFRKDAPRNPLLGTGAATVVGADQDIDPQGRKEYKSIQSNDNTAIKGIYQALIEGRVPFDMAYNGAMNKIGLNQFKVLILANAAQLTDQECQQLNDYVRAGNSIVATYETSINDAEGRRNNFGLSALFGVDFDRSTDSNGPNGYMRIEHETSHPILTGFQHTDQIVTTARRANVKANAHFTKPPLTRIPSYPTDPMEQIYPRVPKTDIPEIYLRELENGSRIVYIPGNIGSTLADEMAPDLALLVVNAVRWALREDQPAVVEGPGIVEVTCWRQKQSMTVHLFNCTNPYYLRSAHREIIPIGEQKVTIKLPEGKKPDKVKLLVLGKEILFKRIEENKIVINIPMVEDHEVIAIDWT